MRLAWSVLSSWQVLGLVNFAIGVVGLTVAALAGQTLTVPLCHIDLVEALYAPDYAALGGIVTKTAMQIYAERLGLPEFVSSGWVPLLLAMAWLLRVWQAPQEPAILTLNAFIGLIATVGLYVGFYSSLGDWLDDSAARLRIASMAAELRAYKTPALSAAHEYPEMGKPKEVVACRVALEMHLATRRGLCPANEEALDCWRRVAADPRLSRQLQDDVAALLQGE